LRAFRAFRATLPETQSNPEVFKRFFEFLYEDLNIPAALGEIFTINKSGPTLLATVDFDRAMYALGFDLSRPTTKEANSVTISATASGSSSTNASLIKITYVDNPPADIKALAEKRWAAKQAKDFATADALRKEITTAGWSMLDRKDGYSLEKMKH
jgi:cysteinyl-tRNA synthetase